jgi:hypothetical protein
MATEETRQKRDEESDSEEEEDDVVEAIPKVEIDPSKLTPLSPEVISKQVSADRPELTCDHAHAFVIGDYQLGCD